MGAAPAAPYLVSGCQLPVTGGASRHCGPRQWPHEDEYPFADAEHPLREQVRSTRRRAKASLKPETPVYLHHDYWPGNTLWKDERLVAVVDWEGGVIGDPAIDVACCAFDISMLGLDVAASHFVAVYRELSGRALPNLAYWALMAAGRPWPDIAIWLPGWEAMGLDMDPNEARDRHRSLIESALAGLPAASHVVGEGPSPAPPQSRHEQGQAPKACSKAARNSGVEGPLKPQ